MITYIITRADGGVTTFDFYPGRGLTLTAALRKEKIRLTGEALTYASHRALNSGTKPENRKFRGAWTDALPGDQVDVDLDKARALLRTKRNTALTILDKEAMTEARKPGGDVTAIDAEAQMLRDLPTDAKFIADDLAGLEELYDSIRS